MDEDSTPARRRRPPQTTEQPKESGSTFGGLLESTDDLRKRNNWEDGQGNR